LRAPTSGLNRSSRPSKRQRLASAAAANDRGMGPAPATPATAPADAARCAARNRTGSRKLRGAMAAWAKWTALRKQAAVPRASANTARHNEKRCLLGSGRRRANRVPCRPAEANATGGAARGRLGHAVHKSRGVLHLRTRPPKIADAWQQQPMHQRACENTEFTPPRPGCASGHPDGGPGRCSAPRSRRARAPRAAASRGRRRGTLASSSSRKTHRTGTP